MKKKEVYQATYVVQKTNLLSQVKYLCSLIQTVVFSFGLERLFANIWAVKCFVFICLLMCMGTYLCSTHPGELCTLSYSP